MKQCREPGCKKMAPADDNWPSRWYCRDHFVAHIHDGYELYMKSKKKQ